MCYPIDWAMGWLTEAVFMGCGEVKLAELRLSEENTTLVELALGSLREPASALWRKMKEYAASLGKRRVGFVKVCKIWKEGKKNCKTFIYIFFLYQILRKLAFTTYEHFHGIYYHRYKYIDSSFIAGMWLYLYISMPLSRDVTIRFMISFFYKKI